MLDTMEMRKPPLGPSMPRNEAKEPPSVGKMAFNLDALSMQPNDGSKPNLYVGGTDTDDISEPTVEGSYSDEDFSIMSEKDFLATHELHMGSSAQDDNENLSLSSINTKALLTITELSKRLRIQENTKLELLNQCLQLEGRLEKNDCKQAYLRIFKAENNQLREASAKMERDFMNDMSEIVAKMTEMEKECTEKLQGRDEKIEILEEELKLLKVSKNLDDVSTTDSVSSKQRGSRHSSSSSTSSSSLSK